MECTIEKGELVIRIPLAKKPEASSSGKTLVCASSHGNVKTNLEWAGGTLTVGLNAYIPNPNK